MVLAIRCDGKFASSGPSPSGTTNLDLVVAGLGLLERLRIPVARLLVVGTGTGRFGICPDLRHADAPDGDPCADPAAGDGVTTSVLGAMRRAKATGRATGRAATPGPADACCEANQATPFYLGVGIIAALLTSPAAAEQCVTGRLRKGRGGGACFVACTSSFLSRTHLPSLSPSLSPSRAANLSAGAHLLVPPRDQAGRESHGPKNNKNTKTTPTF